jgi:hypothetical protein
VGNKQENIKKLEKTRKTIHSYLWEKAGPEGAKGQERGCGIPVGVFTGGSRERETEKKVKNPEKTKKIDEVEMFVLLCCVVLFKSRFLVKKH